jgi:hypothetical protein
LKVGAALGAHIAKMCALAWFPMRDPYVGLRTRACPRRHRQVIWEWLWRSRCEWIGWRKVMADCVFQTAATVMIWFQTAKRLVISVRHSGALIR